MTRMWAPQVECLDREQLGALQLERLREQLGYVLSRSAFYRRKFGDTGLAPDDIRTLADLRRLPFTSKAELRASQEVAPPFGEHVCVRPDEVAWAPTTTGTTGVPVVLPRNEHDIAVWTDLAARAMVCMGVGPGDVYQNIAPYSHSFTGIILHLGAMKAGATVLNTGLGNTQRQLWSLAHFGSTTAHATPSYWVHLGRKAQEEGYADRVRLRIGFGGGEPGMKIEATRARMKEMFPRVEHFLDSYGVTDIGTPIFSECLAEAGGHASEDALLIEVLDQVTGEPVPPGAPGEIVITDLVSKTAPLIRLRVGDLAVYDEAVCECGRTSMRFPSGIIGRTDDMITLKSVNVYPSAIEDLIKSIPESTGEWQLIVTRSATFLDEARLRVEVSTDLAEAALVAARIREKIQSRFRFDCLVEPVQPNTLPNFVLKAKRVIDTRKGERVEDAELRAAGQQQ